MPLIEELPDDYNTQPEVVDNTSPKKVEIHDVTEVTTTTTTEITETRITDNKTDNQRDKAFITETTENSEEKLNPQNTEDANGNVEGKLLNYRNDKTIIFYTALQ